MADAQYNKRSEIEPPLNLGQARVVKLTKPTHVLQPSLSQL